LANLLILLESPYVDLSLKKPLLDIKRLVVSAPVLLSQGKGHIMCDEVMKKIFQFFILLSLHIPSGFASEFSLHEVKGEPIRIAVSDRGRETLTEYFPSILRNFGFAFDKIQIPAVSFDVHRDHEFLNNPKLQAFVARLNPWLPSLVPLNRDYSVSADGIRFESSPPKARFETVASTAYGILVDFSFELNNARLSIESFLMSDLSPEEMKPLGTFGIKDFSLLSDARDPLVISGQMKFEIRNTSPSLLIISLDNNISNTGWDSHVGEFVAPDLKVIINGFEHELSKEHLNASFISQLDQWMDKIQEAFSSTVSDNLILSLNQSIAGALPESLGFESGFPAPGKPLSTSHPDLKLKAEVRSFQMNDYLEVGVAAELSDPLDSTIRTAKVVGANSKPPWKVLGVDRSDLLVSLDSELINRVILASFKRGYFNNIDAGSQSFRLRSLPQVKPLAGRRLEDGRFLIRAAIDFPRSGLGQWAFLNDPIQVEVDIICRLQVSKSSKGIDIVLDSVDTSRSGLRYSGSEASFRILNSSFKWTAGLLPGLKSKIYSVLKTELDKLSKAWKSKPQALASDLELIPSIMGIQLDVKDLVFHSSGNVLFYLDFGDIAQ